MYDRRSSFERRANLHYDGALEDAAFIASEVVRKGRSRGWVEDPAELPVAAEIETILARFNIGYIEAGVWAHKPGGSHRFRREERQETRREESEP
jgi:hypothetical protein